MSLWFSWFDGRKKRNTPNKTNQINQINEIDQLRLHASLTDISEQKTGERVRRAPSPLVAPLPRRSERKPSGILSVTVVPTVILRSVPAFLLRTPGGGSATTANVAERTRSPGGIEDIGYHSCARHRSQRSPCSVRRIPCFSDHGREDQGYPCRGRDLSRGKGYSAAQSVSGNLTQYSPPLSW